MIDGKNQPIKYALITYENIWKITIGQVDDYTSGCLLSYNHFKNYHKMIAIGLSKQEALDTDPKVMQKISFTANLDRAG